VPKGGNNILGKCAYLRPLSPHVPKKSELGDGWGWVKILLKSMHISSRPHSLCLFRVHTRALAHEHMHATHFNFSLPCAQRNHSPLHFSLAPHVSRSPSITHGCDFFSNCSMKSAREHLLTCTRGQFSSGWPRHSSRFRAQAFLRVQSYVCASESTSECG